jgi:hydrogenase expression/formation protein HypC
MCIGLPLQVIATKPGHALCEGRGLTRRVRTALVGEVAPGDWLLVFLDNALERLDTSRAAEINATLDLLDGVLGAGLDGSADAAFDLPSRLSAADLRALSGQSSPAPLLESTP